MQEAKRCGWCGGKLADTEDCPSIGRAGVAPLRPLVSWVGSKRRLAPRIVAAIEALDHDFYVEGFIGMGSVFLARTRAPRLECINDRSLDVVTLFRVAKHHPQALVDEMRLSLTSRIEFQRLLGMDPTTLTDVQRAARFFVLQRLRYGGKPCSNHFPGRGAAAKGLSLDRLEASLAALQRRLQRVVIEALDWAELLHRYDRPGTLFYLDPPYVGFENTYGPGLFDPADHARLADRLLALKGRFILSINDTPEIRTLYSGRASIETVSTVYRVGGGPPKHVTELLISR